VSHSIWDDDGGLDRSELAPSPQSQSKCQTNEDDDDAIGFHICPPFSA
jgi:hypothetical protein